MGAFLEFSILCYFCNLIAAGRTADEKPLKPTSEARGLHFTPSPLPVSFISALI